jgi:hypothetical protein
LIRWPRAIDVDLAVHRAYAGLAPQTATELTRLLVM